MCILIFLYQVRINSSVYFVAKGIIHLAISDEKIHAVSQERAQHQSICHHHHPKNPRSRVPTTGYSLQEHRHLGESIDHSLRSLLHSSISIHMLERQIQMFHFQFE